MFKKQNNTSKQRRPNQSGGHGRPTRLAQHVGEADVRAQRRVHLHPGRHGVKLTVVVQLVQKFLEGAKRKREFTLKKKKKSHLGR